MSGDETVRVLVVDDVLAIRQGINQCLGGSVFQVVGQTRNGQEGIDLAKELQPDVVLLDIVMPVMQGYEALPEIRAAVPDGLVVMLTSTSERELVLQCRKLGADAFVIKHDNMRETLTERLTALWRNRRAKPAS
ncbi:MAG: response regulator transcription factor [Planctomycetota bacterium]|jgi:DNA-binding NarL/FixJ family response regulator|nr:response regulator transcription factor [Planctomycetota bacterium]